MNRKKRSFSKEFKETAVSMVLADGMSQASVTRQLQIGSSTLSKWLKEHRDLANQSEGERNVAARNRELELENRRLRQERDILKKAAVNSTGHCNV